MSWQARRLVDLVDGLASRFNRRRYDALAQRLGRYPHVEAGYRRGFVIAQIDGLAYDYLIEAMARGYIPHLRRLLSQGNYRLMRWHCGLPSTTPAVQAGMMFGDNFDIPGFRWYEKETGQSVVCNLLSGAHALRARMAAAGPGILRGGSSYVSLLDGEATLSLLTLSSLGREHFLENVKGAGFFLLFLLSPLRLMRIAGLSAWEYMRDLGKRLVALFVPGYYKPPDLIPSLLRTIVNALFIELQTFSAYLDIHRGTPAIFTNYYGYDEAAHHFGPDSPEAFRTLRGIDREIGQLERQTWRAQRRRYDFYVISDHGQTPSTTFRQLVGQTLGQYIGANIGPGLSMDERGTGEQISASQARILIEELRDIEERLQPAGARLLQATRRFIDKRVVLYDETEWDLSRRNDVVVRNSGSLAHVYFNVSRRPMDLDEVAVLYPHLLPRLLEQPGIGWIVGRQGEQVVVMNKGGTLTLGQGEHVEGSSPLADLPEPGFIAHQLRRLASHPHSGDLILLGAWEAGRVVSFEDQAASHGGLGGPQGYPFILYPAEDTLSLDSWDGPSALYRHFIRYQHQGEAGAAADDTSDTTLQTPPSSRKESLRCWTPPLSPRSIKIDALSPSWFRSCKKRYDLVASR
jgi:hypothetical protein